MELKIIKEKKNTLFKRNEILAEIEALVTPSRKEIENLLSKKFSTPIENINLKRIKGGFGTKSFNIEANIYDSAEDKEQTEIKTKKQRKALNKKSEGE